MANGQRKSTITWTATHNSGNPNFSGVTIKLPVLTMFTNIKQCHGSLYGTSNHVEVGAQLDLFQTKRKQIFKLIGTAVLSE